MYAGTKLFTTVFIVDMTSLYVVGTTIVHIPANNYIKRTDYITNTLCELTSNYNSNMVDVIINGYHLNIDYLQLNSTYMIYYNVSSNVIVH